jgi:hypothetical protein
VDTPTHSVSQPTKLGACPLAAEQDKGYDRVGKDAAGNRSNTFVLLVYVVGRDCDARLRVEYPATGRGCRERVRIVEERHASDDRSFLGRCLIQVTDRHHVPRGYGP